jgi:hypothetical protein
MWSVEYCCAENEGVGDFILEIFEFGSMCQNSGQYVVSYFLYLYAQSNLVILNSDRSFLWIFGKFILLISVLNINISLRGTSVARHEERNQFSYIFQIHFTLKT